MTQHTPRSILRYTHRALAITGAAGLAGLVASLSDNTVVSQLGIVAVCAAVPGALTLSTIASRLAQLTRHRPPRTTQSTVAPVRRAA